MTANEIKLYLAGEIRDDIIRHLRHHFSLARPDSDSLILDEIGSLVEKMLDYLEKEKIINLVK